MWQFFSESEAIVKFIEEPEKIYLKQLSKTIIENKKVEFEKRKLSK
jgi:hypothetical protein